MESKLKEACQRRPLTKQKRCAINYTKYMDGMQKALNNEIQEDIMPNWRNHNSLKGWCSMNYPSTVTNPMLKRKAPTREEEETKESKLFSNQERPISCPDVRLTRPFSSVIHQGGLNFKPQSALQKNGEKMVDGGLQEHEILEMNAKAEKENEVKEEDPDKEKDSSDDESEEQGPTHKLLGKSCFKAQSQFSTGNNKSIRGVNFKQVMGPNSTVGTIDKHVGAMPAPKKGGAKKKAAEAPKPAADPDAPVEKKVRAKKAAAPIFPIVEPLPENPPQSCEKALRDATSWSNSNNIAKKFAVGTSTTTKYEEKCRIYQEMNALAEEKSSILPLSNFQARYQVNDEEDRFNRRVVKQLNDISFEEDSDDEQLKQLKRMPTQVLDEENLKRILNKDTIRLNLENHYWLKNGFISKMGKMAPNLLEFGLRRMKQIDNITFAEIFKPMSGNLMKIDFCDCEGLHDSALKLLLEKNHRLQEVQLSGCKNALTDSTVSQLANLKDLWFLDISYANQVTDAGLKSFEGKKRPIEQLCVNGMPKISSEGLALLVDCCTETLESFEGAYNGQAQMQSHFWFQIGRCYNLEYFDVSGGNSMDDQGLNLMQKNLTTDDEIDARPYYKGLQYLHTVKLGGSHISSMNLNNLVKIAPKLEHIELTRCPFITDMGISDLLRVHSKVIKFLDLNYVPDLKWPFFDELRNNYPDVLIRRFKHQDTDKKDTGLRVPRRIIEKKKKKKGKKGGKKKK